ncbi:MAG: hypothetical protein Q7S02_05550 [bacterium]|nr:hypothetical protein [bacterium]
MKRSWIILGIAAAVAIGGGVWLYRATNTPSPLNEFATCLNEKGATMYGTYWCPYCKKQKELFGRSFTRAKYVECAMPGNPRSQAPVCRDAGVASYPTWIFADGSRTTGVQELAQLAEKTGCTLPAT